VADLSQQGNAAEAVCDLLEAMPSRER